MKVSGLQNYYTYYGNTNKRTSPNLVLGNSFNKVAIHNAGASVKAFASTDQSSKYTEANPPKTLKDTLDYFSETGRQWAGNYSEIMYNNSGKTFTELFKESMATWDIRQKNEEECLRLEIEKNLETIKNTGDTPESIFDNKYISQDVKDYLTDKPMTAVRYQRLYEQDPVKAQLFLNNIKVNGDYTKYDMDEKYRGMAYTEVLKHVNALLTLNRNDVSEGNYRDLNYLQQVFAIDDGIGITYSAITKATDTKFVSLWGGFDIIPVGDDAQVIDVNTLAKSTEELLEDRELAKNGLMKIRLYAPIGTFEEQDYSVIIEKDKFTVIDKNNSPESDKRFLSITRNYFYSTIY